MSPSPAQHRAAPGAPPAGSARGLQGGGWTSTDHGERPVPSPMAILVSVVMPPVTRTLVTAVGPADSVHGRLLRLVSRTC